MRNTFSTIIQPARSLGLPPRTVVLTFDDGPNARDGVTAELLDVLDRQRTRACFCLRGCEVEAQAGLVRRMHAAGHLLVNHSHLHDLLLATRSVARIGEEIDRCDAAIGRALGVEGYRSRFFRPPGGMVTAHLSAALRQREMRLLPISLYALDNLVSPRIAPLLLPHLLHRLRREQGGILVLHDGLAPPTFSPFGAIRAWDWANRAWVPAVVETLITTLREEGYAFGIAPLQNPASKYRAE